MKLQVETPYLESSHQLNLNCLYGRVIGFITITVTPYLSFSLLPLLFFLLSLPPSFLLEKCIDQMLCTKNSAK